MCRIWVKHVYRYRKKIQIYVYYANLFLFKFVENCRKTYDIINIYTFYILYLEFSTLTNMLHFKVGKISFNC